MKATPWRFGALLASLALLVRCSAVPPQAVEQSAAPANYGMLVANALKGFNGYSRYSGFEISAPRWVLAATGWSWLICVRYSAGGYRRAYVFFINGGAIVNARYDNLSDRCGAQQYLPFDPATGAVTAPAPPPIQQQPIY